mmetsp:Transcript_8553/g.25427  ORF Transcript_8553/g.25427 Transcript_8553/m.25427 type:complete len:204 (+) Transcript_8553:247-858(+)
MEHVHEPLVRDGVELVQVWVVAVNDMRGQRHDRPSRIERRDRSRHRDLPRLNAALPPFPALQNGLAVACVIDEPHPARSVLDHHLLDGAIDREILRRAQPATPIRRLVVVGGIQVPEAIVVENEGPAVVVRCHQMDLVEVIAPILRVAAAPRLPGVVPKPGIPTAPCDGPSGAIAHDGGSDASGQALIKLLPQLGPGVIRVEP